MFIQQPNVAVEELHKQDFLSSVNESYEKDARLCYMHFKDCRIIEDRDLIEFTYENVYFENCLFIDCDFSNCSFTDVLFTACDLSTSKFNKCFFNRCHFSSVKAVGTDFSDSNIKHTRFIDVNFQYADLSYSTFNKVLIKDSGFVDAALTHCMNKALAVENANFQKANFFQTPLKGLNLTTCNIENIVTSNRGEELNGATVDTYQAAELAKLMGLIVE